MIKIPKRSQDRIKEGIRTFQKIVPSLVNRDVSEADTVTVVKDMLSIVFGYDKYIELTSEQQIRGTFCDLAVKIDGKIKYLIEVKAAAISLNHIHLRQAVNYGSHQGIEWIVLTNSDEWIIYRVKFAQPIDFEEVSRLKITEIDVRREEDIRKLFLLCREAIAEGAMDLYHKQARLFNNYTVAQILLSDSVVSAIRKEFRKVFADMKVDQEDILTILKDGIIKRDVLDSDKALDASKLLKKEQRKQEKKRELPNKATPKDSELVDTNEIEAESNEEDSQPV